MHTLWIILACFSGVFAFAYLLAGIMGMQDDEPPNNRSKLILLSCDITGVSALGEALRGAAKNWSTRPDEHRLVYAGLLCLAASMVFVCLAK